MKMFDEVDFDYSSSGFCEYKKNGLDLAEMNVKKSNKDFDKGLYRIISCHNLFLSEQNVTLVTEQIKSYFLELIKSLGINKHSTILLCGLGNTNILADSFGVKVCQKVLATRFLPKKYCHFYTCSICPNVQSVTGIQTFDIVVGVANKINADLIILIDSFMTANPKRLGHSFQLSNVGMTPGGAICDNKKISYEMTNIKCLSIGVPFMLDLKNMDKDFSNIIVAPKDIKVLIEKTSDILANAINSAVSKFSQKEIQSLLCVI